MGTFDGVDLDELVLDSERLILRPWRASDADAVLQAMQDRSMFAYLTLPDPYTAEDAAAFTGGIGDEGRREGTGIGCAVVERDGGRLVGSAALRLPARGHAEAEIGYWSASWARGRGYPAEASRTLAEWAFAHGIGRVEIRCAVQNLASARVAMAAGFSFETVLPARGPLPGGATTDDAMFVRYARDPGTPVAPKFPPVPTLTDGTVALRPLRDDDGDALAATDLDPLSQRWAMFPPPADPNFYRARITRSAFDALVGVAIRFAIADPASGEFAGTLDVNSFGPPGVGLIGYSVHPERRGRGYTGRALRLAVPWLFEQAGFARLELGAKLENVASQKAAQAGGFRPDGVRQARLHNLDGTYSDEAQFFLVNPRFARP